MLAVPRISLCLIVRDEERLLPGCLESVRDAVDELVVVDTGSRDATVAIAERFGARVVAAPWRDDFAAARNEALQLSTGDWVLQLDADERLAPGAASRLRAAVDGATFDCGMLRLNDAERLSATPSEVLAGTARIGEPVHLPRLLRRTPDLRWEGSVHESVTEWLVGRGMKLAFLDVDIVHYGRAPEITRGKDKSRRNLVLLERRCAAEPEALAPYGYLAHEYLEIGEGGRAADVVERGWSLFRRKHHPAHVSVLRLATARARVQLDAGDTAGVLDTLRHAERHDGPHPDLDFLRGTALEVLSQSNPERRKQALSQAADAYRAALGKARASWSQAFIVGATSWAGATRLGTVLLGLGRPREALASFERALTTRPAHREAELGRAEALLETGDAHAALSALEPLLDDRADAWVLAAAAAERVGALGDMQALLARGGAARGGYLAPHRRERHVDLLLAVAIYAGHPMAGPGPVGVVGALLAGQPEASVAAVPLALVERVADNLVRVGRHAALAALVTPAAERRVPGIGATTRRVLARATPAEAAVERTVAPANDASGEAHAERAAQEAP